MLAIHCDWAPQPFEDDLNESFIILIDPLIVSQRRINGRQPLAIGLMAGRAMRVPMINFPAEIVHLLLSLGQRTGRTIAHIFCGGNSGRKLVRPIEKTRGSHVEEKRGAPLRLQLLDF